MTTFYKCDVCGQKFTDRDMCFIHECSHTEDDNKRLVQTILYKGKEPCNYCDYSYYVYNCELECGCKTPCYGYKEFVPVDKFHNKTP